MAKQRALKPEFFEDEAMGRLSRDARLLYLGLWTLADDYGCARGAARFLGLRIFPYDDDLAEPDVQRLLDELVAAERVQPYEVDGQRYVHLPTLARHLTKRDRQAVDRNEALRRCPPPPEIKHLRRPTPTRTGANRGEPARSGFCGSGGGSSGGGKGGRATRAGGLTFEEFCTVLDQLAAHSNREAVLVAIRRHGERGRRWAALRGLDLPEGFERETPGEENGNA